MTDIASPSSLAAELAALTLDLCRIPSETLHEAEIAAWVESRCVAAAGAGAVTRIGNSVVCDPCAVDPECAGLPVVALVGHLDTVKCAEDQEYGIRDGRVYGCGASDMKGGGAARRAADVDLLRRGGGAQRAERAAAGAGERRAPVAGLRLHPGADGPGAPAGVHGNDARHRHRARRARPQCAPLAGGERHLPRPSAAAALRRPGAPPRSLR